jgi:dimeric dUTPase (all-alpha-NTP-PPase superfamily)
MTFLEQIWASAQAQDERGFRQSAAELTGGNAQYFKTYTNPDEVKKVFGIIDKLDEIFEMQHDLDQRIIDERGIEKSLDEWVIGLTIAMESEIDEIRREVPWKWWKNEKDVDTDELRGEVIDLWHFLVSLSQKVGLTPADVYRVYCEKNAENHARQDGTSGKKGYAKEDE